MAVKHRERTVIPQGINLGEVGDIHVPGLQAADTGDDIQPPYQRVFVPENMVERAGSGSVALSGRSGPGTPQIDFKSAHIDHHARLTGDVRHGHRLPETNGQPDAVKHPDRAYLQRTGRVTRIWSTSAKSAWILSKLTGPLSGGLERVRLASGFWPV